MNDFQRFLTELGDRESGNRYDCVNRLGFTGRYQFGEALLIDLKYYQADSYYNGGGDGVDKCYWKGTWTNKAKALGVHNYEQFRKNVGKIQDVIIKEEFKFNTAKIIEYVGGKNNFYEHLRRLRYTYPGILAAAHLQGARGAADLLENGVRRRDENETCITEYAETFSKYHFGEDQLD